MTSRIVKFTKQLTAFKNDPQYSKVKKIYLSNPEFTIASAKKIFNMVKYTQKGEVKKASIQNSIKQKELISSFNNPIKKGQTLQQTNIALNKALKSNKLNLINDAQINILLNNLDSSKKYILNVESDNKNKFFIIDNKTKGFKKIINKNFVKEVGLDIQGSDHWVIDNFVGISKYEIKEINYNQFIDDDEPKKYKMNRNVGLFRFYNNHQGVDLSEYQIFKKDQVIDTKNCLIHSLEKAGVDSAIINDIIIKFSNISETSATDICLKTFEFIKQKEYQNVANMCNRDINITTFDSPKQRKILYSSENKQDLEPIELAVYNNHIFNNTITKYKRYGVINYEKMKHKDDWYLFSEKTNKKDGRFLTAIEVVKLLDDKKYFEPIPQCIELTDDIKTILTSDLLNNLEKDQQLFEYNEKKIFDTKYYFGDLENINNTGSESVPFLAGIIAEHEIEPKISTGLNCIFEMLDYIVVRNKVKINNVLYFHNMKYDFSLMKSFINIISICEKDGAIYSVKILYKKVEIELRDSYKLFSQKLTNFTKAFNLHKDLCKKEAINYDYYNIETIKDDYASIKVYSHGIKEQEKEIFLENVKPFMIDDKKFNHMEYYRYYLKFDCLVLQQGMIAFNKCILETFGKSIYNFLTISSFADDYFKCRNVYDGTYEVKGGLKKFLSKAVYGGRVNVCHEFKKQVIHKKINDFDGVSLYPSAIDRLSTEYGLPLGRAKRYNGDINKDYYIVDIEITKINKKQQNPFIAIKNTASIIYTNEIPEGGLFVTVDRFTLEDYIKFHQIEYNVLDGIYYDEGFNKNFSCIKDVFNERLKQKSLKTPEGNIKQELYKLIMNSAYGKTLLKSSAEKNFIVNEKDFNRYVFNNFNTIKHGKKLSDRQYLITQYEPDNSYNRAQNGIAILSMSKRIMNEVMDTASTNNINIYYQDTDSMHIDDDKIDELTKLYDSKYNKSLVGKNLGQFHSDFNHKNGSAKDVVAIKSIFLGKKAYIDYLEGTLPDGSKEYCTHCRLKGVNEIALINKALDYGHKNIDDNIFNVYEDLSNDNTIEFILNPENKPSFKFTSKGVSKIETNKFKRCVNFISGELNDDENDE